MWISFYKIALFSYKYKLMLYSYTEVYWLDVLLNRLRYEQSLHAPCYLDQDAFEQFSPITILSNTIVPSFRNSEWHAAILTCDSNLEDVPSPNDSKNVEPFLSKWWYLLSQIAGVLSGPIEVKQPKDYQWNFVMAQWPCIISTRVIKRCCHSHHRLW